MFHSNTDKLIDYWRARKSDRQAPTRAAMDPSDFVDLLTHVFILGRTAPGQFSFRLAGGLLTDLHQRDLRRTDFAALWAPADRIRVAAALEASRRTVEPLVLTADARTLEGRTARIEILLAPLRADTLPIDRVIGLYQPLSPLVELRREPIAELGLLRSASADDRLGFPALRLAAVDGQRIA